ncbi:MAG TPA: hypothetical protein V6C71_00365 [Coleofasciculaceae cyanobacterium]
MLSSFLAAILAYQQLKRDRSKTFSILTFVVRLLETKYILFYLYLCVNLAHSIYFMTQQKFLSLFILDRFLDLSS